VSAVPTLLEGYGSVAKKRKVDKFKCKKWDFNWDVLAD
jgi:hypothetical protein